MASETVNPESTNVRESAKQEEKMTVGRYAATRFSTLKPPMDPVPNPFKLLALLNTQQWLFFLIGFIGW